jgi:glycerol-3-phosphate acyltransferase PlsY
VATEFVLLIIGAYLLGSVPTAYLVAKWRRGIDIRRFGSGNVGAANIVAVGSRWSSLIVIVFDLAKGFVPVFVAKQVIDLQQYQQITVGLAAIAGHNWPVFLRFNGGRGILAALGVVFALAPWLALLLVVVAFAWLPFGQFAFGTLLALLLLPILSWTVPGPFGVSRSLELTLGFMGILLIAVIRRLTAPRTELTTTVSQGELIVNRLLYDRDIRDRKAWVSRKPLDGPATVDEVAGQEKEEGQEPH